MRPVRSQLLVLALGSFPSVAAWAETPAKHEQEAVPLMPMEDVEKRMKAEKDKPFLFDANSKERFDKGHLPGARWVKFNDVRADDLPKDKGATLIFYCANEH